MNRPLVSVICLCYNHASFVEEAIRSVLNQTYSNIELIIVDDKSSDDSVNVIRRVISDIPDVKFIQQPVNTGNCRAFNKGLSLASGDFIIDLSADDVLMTDRIEKGVEAFESSGKKVGVVFCDAQLMDEQGRARGYHSDKYPHTSIPQGDVYSEILHRYFINSPTMMIRKEVLDKLGGYDESLAYEDFDFWVRSSRTYQYLYMPEALVKRRLLPSSMGRQQYKKGSRQMESTFKVCEKAFQLNTTLGEHRALRKRVRYELLQTIRVGEFGLAFKYLGFLLKPHRSHY